MAGIEVLYRAFTEHLIDQGSSLAVTDSCKQNIHRQLLATEVHDSAYGVMTKGKIRTGTHTAGTGNDRSTRPDDNSYRLCDEKNPE